MNAAPTSWWNSRPFTADLIAAAVLAVPVLGFSTAMYGPFLGLLHTVVCIGPLAWRRTHTDLAALALTVPHLLQLWLVQVPAPGNVAVPFMIFAVAAHGRPRARPWWLATSVLAALAAAGDWAAGSVETTILIAGLLLSLVAACWALGALTRSLGESRVSAAERARAVEQQQVQQVQLTASEERQRIAREMHDVVAHSLAVIVVQADGGAYAAGMDGDPAVRLATAEKALQTIRATAHDALGETRRLVGVLRSDSGTEREPAAGLGEVFDLVTHLADAGRSVRMEVTGDPLLRSRLGPGLELAAYRIIQEALTNAVKHAGPDARVLVSIDHAPAVLTVQVRDDGNGSTTHDGLGHGLIGMRERVAAFGGTLEAGNHPHGGFVVIARFPTPSGRTP
ncbi:sensor histidine kinase [Propioniciclava soli]|uniref:sensor histidine kinase n=1 Tax=Propioniciclava soli TaxID=2775081 RepID=UPI001E4667A7|nr:histidine kinase [Propioniciclava soli]